ncbi:MAG TPA: FAD-linked oxidase C-terminal domain-containing protein, partial [Thermoleophilaceae bacterium]|nr:FAD-linked oxidase C-terminal domain-containing protein [Thermoleophilaceae bacterium]
MSAALVSRLEGVVGDEHVITHRRQLATYESDGLLQYASTPAMVVLPGSADEVAAVVRACHEAEMPWTARGAGSGLSGGAMPVEGGVLIGLSRMRSVLEVDLDNGRVLAEPGVTNIAVSQAVGPTHFYPPDPSSQIVCTIGGNVAENSGGAHCFKYGFTTNYVTGLELVLPDGSQISVGGRELDHPGYDLMGAFVGSEGTLGIATGIWLRVVPRPEAVRTLVAFFDSTVQAGEVVSEIVSQAITPGAIEMMDNLSIRAAEGATNAGYPVDAGAALVVELDGSEAECEARFEQVVEICEEAGANSVRVAADEAERELIWRTRKAAFAAMGRVAPNYYVQDSVIPRTRLAEVLGQIDELASEHDLQVANVFHAGDGNLHPLVCYDAGKPGEAERAEELAGLIVKACVDAGGSITGEHGVGVDKKRYMPS